VPLYEGGDVDSMWMKIATCIRKVASQELGVIKGGKCESKETWWWNENMQKVIKEKKLLGMRAEGPSTFP
jgi:hypothetical protein